MAYLSEQVFASLLLPLDARLSNLVQSGANMIVETQAEYLARVDEDSRYLGMSVVFYEASGVYTITNFLSLVNDGTITNKTSTFTGGITDGDFVELITESTSTEDITVAGIGTLGGYSDGDTISSGTTLNDFIKGCAQKRQSPTYSAPSVSLSVSPSGTQEIGDSVSFTLTPNYTARDAGAITSVVFTLGGTTIRTQADLTPHIDNNRIVPAGALNYGVEVHYADGAIKNDTLGDPDATGQILAGNVSGVRSITGSYYNWYEAMNPTTSVEARTMSRTFNNTFTLNTGSSSLAFTILLPPAKTLVSVIDEDALGTNLTADYVSQGTFSVDDGGGNPVNYNKYVLNIGVPYSSNHRHNVTIS